MEVDFKTACENMGGKYESELGALEPDVGGEFFGYHEALKEWCTFEGLKGLKGGAKLIVFNAPNTFSICLVDRNGNQLFEFWDNDVEKHFTKGDKPLSGEMCFTVKYGVRLPKSRICVAVYPSEVINLEIKPIESKF